MCCLCVSDYSSTFRLEPPTRWVPHTSEYADMPSSFVQEACQVFRAGGARVEFLQPITASQQKRQSKGLHPWPGLCQKYLLQLAHAYAIVDTHTHTHSFVQCRRVGGGWGSTSSRLASSACDTQREQAHSCWTQFSCGVKHGRACMII